MTNAANSTSMNVGFANILAMAHGGVCVLSTSGSSLLFSCRRIETDCFKWASSPLSTYYDGTEMTRKPTGVFSKNWEDPLNNRCQVIVWQNIGRIGPIE
eukprot:2170667-Amphidinium_carterae.2